MSKGIAAAHRGLIVRITCCFVVLWAVAAGARADDLVPLSSLTGKTGRLMNVQMPERSPLSAQPEVAKRLSLKPANLGPDYDLAKEPFCVYLPKDPPAERSKYGLIVGLNFNGYPEPPMSWWPVLDKYHLIWAGATGCNDQVPAARRAGLMLDAVQNLKKAYPIDDARVYVSMNTTRTEATAVPLCYADVFQGAIYTVSWNWFTKNPNPAATRLNVDTIPRPEPQVYSLAKSRGRYFLAYRKNDLDAKGNNVVLDILKFGYQAAGFKYVKAVGVTTDQLGHYAQYTPDWFEEAVQFLDAPVAELAQQPGGSPKPAAEATGPTPPKAAGAAAPSSAPAAAAATAKPASKEEQAAKALGMAKNYVTSQRYDAARPRLKKIVDTYPGTPGATEAAQILQDIDGK